MIFLPRLLDPGVLPVAPSISTITLAELSVGPRRPGPSTNEAARQAHLQQAEADFEPLPFDAEAAAHLARWPLVLVPDARLPARAYDAMIAATAIANGLSLFTCNPDDFIGIEGLAWSQLRIRTSTRPRARKRPATPDPLAADPTVARRGRCAILRTP